jgi:hypothetical protein
MLHLRNSVFTLAATVFLAISMFTNCESSANDGGQAAAAEAAVVSAKQDWVEAQRDSVADYQKFEAESKSRVIKNSHIIADFKVRIMTGEKAMKYRYQRRLNALEKQNNDLRKRLEQYTETGAEQWEIFKRDWDRDMGKLVKSLDEMTGSNK